MDRQEVHERFERIRRRAYQKIEDEWRRVMANQPRDPADAGETRVKAPSPVGTQARRRAARRIKAA